MLAPDAEILESVLEEVRACLDAPTKEFKTRDLGGATIGTPAIGSLVSSAMGGNRHATVWLEALTEDLRNHTEEAGPGEKCAVDNSVGWLYLQELVDRITEGKEAAYDYGVHVPQAALRMNEVPFAIALLLERASREGASEALEYACAKRAILLAFGSTGTYPHTNAFNSAVVDPQDYLRRGYPDRVAKKK